MHLRLNALLSVGLLALSAPLWAAKRVDLDYQVRFLPASDEAEVRLTLAKGDSIYLNSIVPHHVACSGNVPASIYAVLYFPE